MDSFNTWKERLQHPLEWLLELESTPQDPIWHAEGNVAIHTQMVLDNAYQHSAGLSATEQRMLVLSALLHDIGKSQCTTTEADGRVTSRRHPTIGRDYLANKFWPLLDRLQALALPLSYAQLFDVINMVGLHHQPSKLLHNNKQQSSYWHLASQCPMHLLHKLALSDAYGRISPQPDTTIDLFAEALTDHHVNLEAPYALWEQHFKAQAPNALTADFWLGEAKRLHRLGRVHSPEQVCAMYHPKQHKVSQLVMLCGLSGSGKSRLVHAQYSHMLHISLDELRTELAGQRSDQSHNGQVLQAAYSRLKQALAKKQDVVFDATNLRYDFRSRLFQLATDYGALCTLEVMHTPLEVCLRQNRNRSHVLMDSIITKQAQAFEFPYTDESHRCHFRNAQGHTMLRTGFTE